MYKIAVMGDRDSVLGFPMEDRQQARQTLHRLAKEDYAIIYMTEQLAQELTGEIDQYKDELTPAVILIPGRQGSLGIGADALQQAVERAVGANIL